MQDLFRVLSDPSASNLHKHEIFYFDKLLEAYPDHYKKIITYINECFNFQSPLLVKEKDWGIFLRERFRANKLPEHLRIELIEYESEVIVLAIDAFLTHQKEPNFQTLIAKQNLRSAMLVMVQKFDGSITDKQKANELITTLDFEITEIFERMRQDQKVFGNHAGYKELQAAKSKHLINVANFVP